MADVSERELRNHTREVLERVQGGESVRVTVNRRPVAKLVPLRERSAWVPGRSMEKMLQTAAADAGLLEDIRPLREQLVEPE